MACQGMLNVFIGHWSQTQRISRLWPCSTAQARTAQQSVHADLQVDPALVLQRSPGLLAAHAANFEVTRMCVCVCFEKLRLSAVWRNDSLDICLILLHNYVVQLVCVRSAAGVWPAHCRNQGVGAGIARPGQGRRRSAAAAGPHACVVTAAL